ncbi:MAG: hypothetical protein EPN91_08615 [Salinibacterium sp.]|nr:MAG: hypothetical protein EPN91_08615 [Salinibacterium sp.]
MNGRYNSIVLFTPPRLAEERKTYWPGMSQYSQPAVATGLGEVTAVGPSGNTGNDILAQLHNNFVDLIGTFTGQKSQEKARQDALYLAQLQQQQYAFEAQQRTEGWSRAAPWLTVGGAVVAVAVVMAARK